MPDEHRSDFLVIGSGIAGLSFALKAAEAGTVTVITKKESTESNTNYAQGGIAAVLDPDDSFDSHKRDTLDAGADLCRPEIVEVAVAEGPRMVQDLIAWGVEFTKKASGGDLSLGREGGHSKNRIVHAADLTGQEIERALTEAIMAHPRITCFEHHVAIDLITEHHLVDAQGEPRGRIHCWGAYALETPTGRIRRFLAPITLLSTGGCGQIYQHTTNPRIATGDGIAMAFRAGASVGNLEFMQFHPTSLYHPEARSFLISEVVRGFGGTLISKDGRAFIDGQHEMGSLAPRDIVARAIDAELKKSGEPCVFLDVTHKPADAIRDTFPNIFARCKELNLDITVDPIPVVPAAHYMCGGVYTDRWGRTELDGLYASGEVACTGLHGANRLASNSLLEALVFSERALRDASARLKEPQEVPEIPSWREDDVFNTEEWVLLEHDRDEVRRLMWDYVGIVRTDFRLKRAARRIGMIAHEVEEFYKRTKVTEPLVELRNLATIAALTVRCALNRRESRGLHYNLDFPRQNEAGKPADTVLSVRETWRSGPGSGGHDSSWWMDLDP